MASSGRRTDPGLEDLLFRQPYDFGFFQAVRLLARIYPSRGPVGVDVHPSDELVRFAAHESMEFPASQIRSIDAPESESRPAGMIVAFMGLTGPVGVLPWHYTELLIKLQFEKNPSLREFFDLFNHRMISLFYKAWEKHHFFVSYERQVSVDHLGEPDEFTHDLFDLIGMGTDGLRGRLSFSDYALLPYAGLITQRPHSASALRGILQDYFDVPVEVKQFCGKWFDLESSVRTCLGSDGSQNQLGDGAVAGDAVWNQQVRIQLQLGPMPLDRFKQFLPGGNAYRALLDWMRFFIGPATEFEIQPILNAAEVPKCFLSDEASDAPRLGWMSWLKTEEFDDDARDAVFSGLEVAST